MDTDSTDPAREQGAPRRRALPRWKRALLGLAVAAVLLGLLELALALCGVRPVLNTEDPFVGFDGTVPLFVEKTRPDGKAVLRTALNKRPYFNRQEFPREKAPGTVRIFCLGGSTTHGSPYGDPTSFCGWLRRLLPAADPSRRWEIVNAGGLSYASYRVAIVMKELCRYEPDAFIVYCGHNEFLEKRTYRRILATPGPLVRAATLASRTRTGAAIRRALAALGIAPRKPPTGRHMLPAEVETLLDNSVGPTDYSRDDAQADHIVAHYRLNLRRLADIARLAGAQLVLITPASNLRDSSPFKSQHRDGLSENQKQQWEALYKQGVQRLEAGDAAAALPSFEAAAAIDARHAALHYRRGRALHALARYAEAKTAFERARDEDVCPLRALTRMGPIVRKVAEESALPLVDFARWVEGRSPHAIPGREHFLDHIHPRVLVHRGLALAVLDALAERGLAEPTPSWGQEQIDAVTRKVDGLVNTRAQGRALRNLSKVLGWAGKFEESRSLALEAIELLGEDAESLFQVGAYSHVLGDHAQAEAYLRRAAAASPASGRAHLWLGRTLLARGQRDQAIAHLRQAVRLMPGNPEAQRPLDAALAKQAEPPSRSGRPPG